MRGERGGGEGIYSKMAEEDRDYRLRRWSLPAGRAVTSVAGMGHASAYGGLYGTPLEIRIQKFREL